MARRLAVAAAVVVTAGIGCTSEPEPTAGDLCGASLSDLRTLERSLNDGCRQALGRELPAESGNLKARVFALGSGTSLDGRFLYVAATGPNGEALPLTTEGVLRISSTKDGVTTNLARGLYEVQPLRAQRGTVFSLELLLDVTATMNDGDLQAQRGFFASLLEAIPGLYEGEILAFAGASETRLGFGGSPPSAEDVKAALEAAPSASTPRDRGALYDAVGAGLDALAGRVPPVHLLVASTDGVDTASSTYDRNAVASRGAETNATLVLVGSRFAEGSSLAAMGGARGTYVYGRDVTTATAAAKPFVDALANGVVVLVKPPHDAADSITVGTADSSADFPRSP